MAVATEAVRSRILVRSRRDARRQLVDRFMRGLSLVAAISCVVPLAAVIFFVVVNGISAVNLDLLTKPARALGIGGGADRCFGGEDDADGSHRPGHACQAGWPMARQERRRLAVAP